MDTPNFQRVLNDRDIQQGKNNSMGTHSKSPYEMQPAQTQEELNLQNMGPDPFAIDQFSNVGLPDQPIGNGGGMAEQLLNDNEVPEHIKKKHWWIFHKDNTLTFLDENRKNSKLLNFDIAKIDALCCIPYYDYTFEQEYEYGIMRNIFETKLDRALGFKGGNVKNERVMLQSQFSENRQISEVGQGGMIKEGFFKRLLGRR